MSRFEGDVHAVILAGGSGTRFWPKSRQLLPKQLCRIADPKREMILSTVDRLLGEIPNERRTIVTHKDQVAATKDLVGAAVGHYLAEPQAKNTLAALTWAALAIRAQDPSPSAVMMSLHADHVITNPQKFLDCLQQAVAIAREDKLCLIGITPTHPETGYGYIEQGDALDAQGAGYAVKSFREKPDLKTATSFLETGRFLWNSGLFVWQVSTFLAAVAEHAPATFTALKTLYRDQVPTPSALAEVYASLDTLSVDEAILERSSGIAVVAGDFGWQDVGSWEALDSVIAADGDGNRLLGETVMLDCRNTTVDSDGPLVAAIGVDDLVIVHHRGAILVCPKNRSQDVKTIVAMLKAKRREDLL